MINLFSYNDYRQALREALAEKRELSGLTNRELAEAMRVQPSYFSRLIQGNAHASADQLFLGCQALGFSDEETQYLLLLLDWDRCVIVERKSALKKQIEKIQDEKRSSSRHLKADFIEPENTEAFSEYYLDPMTSLVHTFLSLKEYQSSPELICSCLGLSEARLREVLLLLTKLGIIGFDKKKNGYQLLKDHMHLASSSSLNRAYQTLFRHAALEHLKRTEAAEKFEFAVTFSADDETRRKIHDEFNLFAKRIEGLVRVAPSEGVFQLNFDLFRWDTQKTIRKWATPVVTEQVK